MIIRGGENIYPREIEEFLYTNPKIDEVEVFGVPDPKYGEQVAAWIRLKHGEHATAEEIKTFCKGELAHFKIPCYVKFVDEFPMTVTGKVQKFIMREQTTEALKLAS
jgi:fatty-acyl-CoA synthase